LTALSESRQQRTQGRGHLAAKALDGKSRIAELYQEGAAKIRLPQTFTDEMEAVIINMAGGLTGGDRMDWSIAAGGGTFVTATTQACEKIYKASFGTAEVATQIVAGPGAKVHWLPQESILFDNASLTRRLEADLDETAEFIAVEAILLGRKAMGEAMTRGTLRDRWRIRRAGRLIHAEELRMEGDVAALTALGPVLAGQVAFATVLYTGPLCEALLPQVRAILSDGPGGASQWNGKLVVRMTAVDGFQLRQKLVSIVSALRAGATMPKVWNL